jgi:hypothetical protein
VHLFRSVASPAVFPIKARWGEGAWGSGWPDNVHETGVSRGGQCGSPIVATEAEQVERTRRKTWSRARSEVLVPYTRTAQKVERSRRKTWSRSRCEVLLPYRRSRSATGRLTIAPGMAAQPAGIGLSPAARPIERTVARAKGRTVSHTASESPRPSRRPQAERDPGIPAGSQARARPETP